MGATREVDRATEATHETVHGVLDLLIDATTLLLAVGDGLIDELGVIGLLHGSQDEGAGDRGNKTQAPSIAVSPGLFLR